MATVITTLSQLNTACSSGGTYELGANISGVAVTVATGKTLNLDLKTYTLTGTGRASVINVKGTLNLSGTTGKITGGSSASGGGVLVLSGSTFTMSGGSIVGNSASKFGGGVYVANGKFTMSGGSITGNTAGEKGGGVIVIGDNGKFNVSGAPVIKGNTKNGAANNVYLNEGEGTATLITVTGPLTSGAEIYVNFPTGLGTQIGTNTSGYTGVEHILSDNGLYMGGMSGTNVVWVAYVPPVTDVKIRVKTSSGWKSGIVRVKTADGWKKAKAVRVKTSSGWKEAKQI